MGVDLIGKKHHTARRVHSESPNPYLIYLVKLCKALAQKTGSKGLLKAKHQLTMSSRNRQPVSVGKISTLLHRQVKTAKEGKVPTAVICATVTAAKPGDVHLLQTGMRVAALRFTEQARQQIEAKQGTCLTIDEYLASHPDFSSSMLIRGPQNRRKATKYFGRPAGAYKSKTKARVFNERKERAHTRCSGGSEQPTTIAAALGIYVMNS